MPSLNAFQQSRHLGLGCSTFGGSKSKKTALRTLDASFERGINYCDVARSYGYGQAECIVGEFAKGKRDRLFIATKFGISPPRTFFLINHLKDYVRYLKRVAPKLIYHLINKYSRREVTRLPVTPELAMKSLEKSLCELQTDYVDLFLLHNCPYDQAIREDIFDRLEKAKDAGKLRKWGATCEETSMLSQFFSEESPFDVVQFPYSAQTPYLSSQVRPDINRVIFSVMNQATLHTHPGPRFFQKLPINQIVPGLVQNFREAWLYIALQEMKSGVVLCSMTQVPHIEQNLKIYQAPSISSTDLFKMKQSLIKGRILTKREAVTPGSFAANYLFRTDQAPI